MISFRKGNNRFMARTAAVFIHRKRILLHQAEGNNYWSLPGGRIEFTESSRIALIREMREELNYDIAVIRLLWLIENFFRENRIKTHEIGFYYLAEFPGGSTIYQTKKDIYGKDGKTKLTFRWVLLNELENIPLFPSFLRTSLQHLPLYIHHIVHRDNESEGNHQ
jgi:ADP-ribose pyrophosphatase YjhB (NUDIX family)